MLRRDVPRGALQIEGESTDEQRQHHDKIVRLKVRLSSEGAQQPIDSPIGKRVYAGLSNAYDGPDAVMLPVRLRMMGATVPTQECRSKDRTDFLLDRLAHRSREDERARDLDIVMKPAVAIQAGWNLPPHFIKRRLRSVPEHEIG